MTQPSLLDAVTPLSELLAGDSRCAKLAKLLTEWEASPNRRKTLEQVFWPKVQKGGPDDCWPWIGAHGPSGHPQLRILKQHVRATAIAYWFDHREWPADWQENPRSKAFSEAWNRCSYRRSTEANKAST